MNRRAALYRRKEKSPGRPDTVIVAHLGKTSKGKIRLYSVWLRGKDKKEELVGEKLLENDPRYVFENEYAMRKTAHEIVRKSGRYTRFFDSGVRIVYDTL